MALQKNVNSYATVDEANIYFEDRLNADNWTSATSPNKEKALITATAMLENYSWIGVAVSESQSLSFPRSGVVWDPKLNEYVELDETETPAKVLKALYELALHLLSNSEVLESSSALDELHVGSIKLIGLRGASETPGMVKDLIRDYVMTKSKTRTWWRAN